MFSQARRTRALSVSENVDVGRERINLKEQFIMWFSGLRGAIAFSLVLNMQVPFAVLLVLFYISVGLFTSLWVSFTSM